MNTRVMAGKIDLLPELERYIKTLEGEVLPIHEDRRRLLNRIAAYIREKRENGRIAHLIFICTHNSRRSHMAQLWTDSLVHHLGLGENIACFSGGTELTAFHPNAVEAMRRAGFGITDPGGENPVYLVRHSTEVPPMPCFSKKYDHPDNPREGFAAIMVCSDADEACPFIPGAELRIVLPFRDPKEADGTPEESATYDARCMQIATEMYWMLDQVKLT